METLGERLRSFRFQQKLTIDDFVYKYNTKFDSGISKSMVSRWENNLAEPKIPVGRNIAIMYGISFDELVGLSNTNNTSNKELNAEQIPSPHKDKNDIAANLSAILEQMDHNDALMFDGEVLDETTKNLIIASIKSSYEMARIKLEQKKDKE